MWLIVRHGLVRRKLGRRGEGESDQMLHLEMYQIAKHATQLWGYPVIQLLTSPTYDIGSGFTMRSAHVLGHAHLPTAWLLWLNT